MNKLLTTLSILLIATAGYAQSEIDSSGNQMKMYFDNYVNIINSRDPQLLKDLIHPSTKDCITPETEGYYEYHVSSQMQDPIIKTIHVFPRPFWGDQGNYPVLPTTELEMNFEIVPGYTVLHILTIAEHEGKLHWVLPCWDAADMVKHNAMIKKREHAMDLVSSMLSEQKQRLTELIKQGEDWNYEAAVIYKEESGEDPTVSYFVINFLKRKYFGLTLE